MTRSLQEKSASLKMTMTQLQDTYLMTIEALAAAVEARDPYTHGHTQRVGDYAVILGKSLDCDETELAAIKRASVLHDIGKIGIEDHILRKQARLEPDEQIRMQKHPIIGVDMLKGIDFLDPVLPLIRHHHERWDGNGYPDEIRADEIPARRAHPRGCRRARRHDLGPSLPRRPGPSNSPRPRSSRVLEPTSTLRWSRPSSRASGR